MAVTLKINGRDVVLDIPDDTPLLWAVRDELDLKGTKFGCGIGMCGACTVHVNGVAQRSCITPVASLANASITTIEGLNAEGEHPLQQAWIATKHPSAATASRGKSCRLQVYWQPTPIRQTLRSIRPWAATCAAAWPTPESKKPSSWLPQQDL